MSGIVELKLYSPLQVDIIDRDTPDPPCPLQAARPERKQEYLERFKNELRALQFQEDARHAFTAPEQDWSDICEKIVSLTRTIEVVNGRLYGAFTCESTGRLDPQELNSLKWYCRDQWENGWGEGYAYCPREGIKLGLYIHFWQDSAAPLVTLAELRQEEQRRAAAEKGQRLSPVTEITPDAFWTLLAQAKEVCGGNQKAAVYWLVEQLVTMGAEQALNFHSIFHGYMELADKYGLWNAATLIHEDGCYVDGFEDFRAWLIFQGKETYLAALKDPDSLANVPACAEGNCRFADLLYAGSMAYARLTNREAHKDISPADHQSIVSELRKDIVYGAEIDYPHEWSEVAAYLPHLIAQHLTPKELRACICRGHMWNHDDPDIQKARAAAPKKKRARTGKKKDGECR
ncbi:DUF4240 domain-containing protein [Oscillibacter sp.]|uniref:DUF4240 domain-containing protein n=1 Tax=Oscillibacter sp. TaxID=1945593 RepID=UPI002D7F9AEB|nr:DUF4240 domain-containing protein [Oscillibacter sp.]